MNVALLAIGLMCLCKLVFAFQDVIIKEMSDGYPVHEIMVIRCLVAIIILYLAIRVSKDSISLDNKIIRHLLFRGALLFGSFISFYLGLSAIPLTTVTVLFFTAPFFITMLSIPLLGETVGIRRWIGVGIGFLGVLIVLRPDSTGFDLEILLPVIAAFLYSIGQLIARNLGNKASAACMTFYANISYLIFGLIVALCAYPFEPNTSASASLQFLLRPWQMPQKLDWLLICLTGFTGALGFWLSTQAYRISEASKVAPFEYMMLIWIPILSYLCWREIPDAPTITGSIIIVCAGLYVLRREDIKTNKPIVHRSLNRAR